MMNSHRIGRWQAFVLALVMTVMTLGNIVFANSLPSPTFYTEFNNAPEGRPYYVILLTDAPEYNVPFYDVGVHGTVMDEQMLEDTSIPEFIETYEDPDGFHIADNPVIMCEGDTYNGYFVSYEEDYNYRFIIYWDDTGEYKITESFKVSEARYSVDLSEDGELLSIEDVSFDYWIKSMLPGTLFRVVFTVVLEFIIALFFCFFRKKELLTVLVTNIVSNLIAQAIAVLLFGIYLFGFLLIEIAVIVVEFYIYRKFFDKGRSNGRIWAYTIVANLVTAAFSFVSMCFELLVLSYTR